MHLVPLDTHPDRIRRQEAAEAVLEEALARVQAGEVVEVAMVLITPTGSAHLERTAAASADVMLGALRRLEHEILQAVR